jgi:hypothetical protein
VLKRDYTDPRDEWTAMFPALNTIMRHAGKVALTTAAAVCVLAISAIALVLTLMLAPPLKQLGSR